MITMISKNGGQSVSLRNRESYYEGFETNNFPKGKKNAKQEIPTLMSCLHY